MSRARAGELGGVVRSGADDDELPMTMPSLQHALSRRARTVSAGAAGLLLVLLYLYVLLGIDPALVYHQQCPIFLTTVDFLTKSLDQAGGPAEYVSTLLSQCFHYPWAGALVITAIAGLICLATHALLTVMAGRPLHPAASFVPAVLLAMLYGRYRHYLVTDVTILAAVALANGYARLRLRRAALRLTAYLVLSAALYWAVGGMVLLFAVLCAIFELLKERRIVLGLLCALCTPVAPWVFAQFSFDVAIAQAFVPLLPSVVGSFVAPMTLATLPVVLHLTLVVFFPVAAILAGLRPALAALHAALRRKIAASWATLRGRAPDDTPTEPRPPSRPVAWRPLPLALFLAAAALFTGWTFNVGLKRQIRVDDCAERRQWERLLEEARRLPTPLYDVYVMHDVNRALYYTGRLPWEMFSYPQKRGMPSLQLSVDEKTPIGYRKFAEFCLELGLVNLAQHFSHLALEMEGERPEVLKRLARTNVLKGRAAAARVFLGALSKHLLYGGWAREYVRRLDDDPVTAHDAEVEQVRTVMLDRQHGYGGFQQLRYEDLLLLPLETNPKNRMAFEYLMAHYLLAERIEDLVDHLDRLDDFGYVGIPRHWEEAIVVCMRTRPRKKIDLHGRQLTNGVTERFRDFEQDLIRFRASAGREKEAALDRLVEKWGGSYFFYVTFGFCEPRRGWRVREPDVLTGATP